MAKKFLDYEGLERVWGKVKDKISADVTAAKTELIGTDNDQSSEDTIKAAKKYTDEKIAGIPAAIVYKADNISLEQSGSDEVTFSVKAVDMSKVTGLSNALAGKADASHTHEISDINNLQTTLDSKADKSVALKEITGEATADASKVTITLTETTVANGSTEKPIDIPAATASNVGVITENRVKALAGEVATSVYRVKGTKATIDEVLAISNAVVGDVYNVTAEFTLNGQKFPAGTNVVCITATTSATGNDEKWDALGGTVDLSPYAKSDDVANTYATKDSLNSLLSDFTAHTAESTRGNLHLPEVKSEDNGKVLGVINGETAWATMSLPLAEGKTTAGIVKAADDSVIITGGTIKVEVLSSAEIDEICV